MEYLNEVDFIADFDDLHGSNVVYKESWRKKADMRLLDPSIPINDWDKKDTEI
jgi:hypothetical protein